MKQLTALAALALIVVTASAQAQVIPYVAGRLMNGASRDSWGGPTSSRDSSQARLALEPILSNMPDAELLDFVNRSGLFFVDSRRTGGGYYEQMMMSAAYRPELAAIPGLATTRNPEFAEAIYVVSRDSSYGQSHANRPGLDAFKTQILNQFLNRRESIWAKPKLKSSYIYALIHASFSAKELVTDEAKAQFISKALPSSMLSYQDRVLALMWLTEDWTKDFNLSIFNPLLVDQPKSDADTMAMKRLLHHLRNANRKTQYPANASEEKLVRTLAEVMRENKWIVKPDSQIALAIPSFMHAMTIRSCSELFSK